MTILGRGQTRCHGILTDGGMLLNEPPKDAVTDLRSALQHGRHVLGASPFTRSLPLEHVHLRDHRARDEELSLEPPQQLGDRLVDGFLKDRREIPVVRIQYERETALAGPILIALASTRD